MTTYFLFNLNANNQCQQEAVFSTVRAWRWETAAFKPGFQNPSDTGCISLSVRWKRGKREWRTPWEASLVLAWKRCISLFSHVPLVRSQSHSSAWMQGRLWNRIPAWGSSQQQLSGTCTRGQQESLATGCQALPHYGFQNWPLRERWGWPYLPKITLASTALFFTITCLHLRMNYRWPPPPWF